jgi:hypothetical protein
MTLGSLNVAPVAVRSTTPLYRYSTSGSSDGVDEHPLNSSRLQRRCFTLDLVGRWYGSSSFTPFYKCHDPAAVRRVKPGNRALVYVINVHLLR